MDTTSFDASGITATLNQPLLNVRGQGVLIGFLDTGIDYLREDFKAVRRQNQDCGSLGPDDTICKL